nr:hypothetical protein [Tanacetum cinerariifolium]
MMISLCMWCVSGKKSGLPDEVFTACVIKRYREDQCDDSTVAVVAASDGVQVTSMLKRHSEEIGESSETMVTASGVADEVLAANVQNGRGVDTLLVAQNLHSSFICKNLILSHVSFWPEELHITGYREMD